MFKDKSKISQFEFEGATKLFEDEEQSAHLLSLFNRAQHNGFISQADLILAIEGDISLQLGCDDLDASFNSDFIPSEQGAAEVSMARYRQYTRESSKL